MNEPNIANKLYFWKLITACSHRRKVGRSLKSSRVSAADLTATYPIFVKIFHHKCKIHGATRGKLRGSQKWSMHGDHESMYQIPWQSDGQLGTGNSFIYIKPKLYLGTNWFFNGLVPSSSSPIPLHLPLHHEVFLLSPSHGYWQQRKFPVTSIHVATTGPLKWTNESHHNVGRLIVCLYECTDWLWNTNC